MTGSRARCHDERGQKRNLCCAMPACKLLQSIRAQQKKELRGGSAMSTQAKQRVHRKVGLTIFTRSIQPTQCKSRFVGDGQRRHGGPMLKVRGRFRFQRLSRDRCKQD